MKRSVMRRESDLLSENDNHVHSMKAFRPPVIRKGKLVIVDLAGSERIHKSGVYIFYSFVCSFFFI